MLHINAKFSYNIIVSKEVKSMAEYFYIQNYARRGTLAISNVVFDQICSSAIEKIKGVKLSKSNDKFPFRLHKPIHCEIKDGGVIADLNVIISKDVNVNDICLSIQEEVVYAITSMTELIPFSVNVKVVGIE